MIGCLTALVLTGIHPVIPWSFLVLLSFLIPVGWWLNALIRALSSRVPLWAAPILGVIVMIAVTALRKVLVGLGLGLMVAFVVKLLINRRRASVGGALMGVVAVFLGNVSVWAANYLALTFGGPRIADATFRQSDIWLYSVLAGHAISYDNWFPLISQREVMTFFEVGYALFFPQLALISFVHESNDRARAEYLTRLYLCYLIAILAFLILPVAGPCLAYPESIRFAFGLNTTGQVMNQSRQELAAILSGGQPLTGLGYFVAFPSMHAAAAVVFQGSLEEHRFAYWMMLPVNVVLVVATVILGYHYILDIPAGLFLGWLSVKTIRFRRNVF
jgi:membrane-associated phospholipid phosphatase